MSEAKPISVGDENFEEEVLKSDTPVLVDFWAAWCGPCQTVAPVLDKIAEEYQGRLKVCKLDVDQGRETAVKYGITSIPTLNIYKDGEVVEAISGVSPNFETSLKEKIEPYLEK